MTPVAMDALSVALAPDQWNLVVVAVVTVVFLLGALVGERS